MATASKVFTKAELDMVRDLYQQMQQIKGKTKKAEFMVKLPDEQREVMMRWICQSILGRVTSSS